MNYYPKRTTQEKAEVYSAFSSRVYGWMTVGLALTASIAFFLFASGAYAYLLPFWWVWAFGGLGVSMALGYSLQRLSIGAILALFLSYAALQGLCFGTILPGFAAAFGGQVIWMAFASAGVIFALAALYGRTTKSDLTQMGRILSLALIGLIVVSLLFLVLSFFFQVGWMDLLISYLGLAIFIGLTAYDAQTIRQFALQTEAQGDSLAAFRLSILMALRMYVNVIMIFWYLLRIFSNNRK